MSDGRLGQLGVVGEAQEGVDGVARLAAEPGDELRAAAQRAEQGRVESERAVPAGEIAPARQGCAGAPRRRVACRGMVGEGSGQGRIVGAADGDADEIVVVEADERRFQRRRQRQVVVGQERRAAGRDEVEHGDVLADVEAVGAGHRHARLLEGADHGLEGRPALAHEDEDVAGAPTDAGLVALVRPDAHGAGDATRHHDRRRGRLGGVDRQGPGVGLVVLFGPLGRPQLDEARRLRPCALVHRADHRVLERQPAEMALDREGRVDCRQHRLGRAERQGQAHVLEGELGGSDLVPPLTPAPLELARLGALKAVDRLLRIADREERAHLLARAPRGRP